VDIKKNVEIIAQKRNGRIERIIDILDKKRINHSVLTYNSGKNIEISFKGEIDKDIIFFAHHDISSQTSEGANDNSSSVAVLIEFAELLVAYKPFYNIKIVFTDNEEILGGLLCGTENIDKLTKIITAVGSFDYLKKYSDRSKIVSIFNLELCGIGDSIMIAEYSGKVKSSDRLVVFIENIAKSDNYKYVKTSVANSDLLSSYVLGIPGILIGIIPYSEAQYYNCSVENKKDMPSVWKNIHSDKDNIAAIQERALVMMYKFLERIADNFGNL